MKKTKENWKGEQCIEIEENLRKNNSKRPYQLAKDLTTVKQEKATTVQDRLGKCLTEERQMLNRGTAYCSEAVQPQGQWRSISTELYPDEMAVSIFLFFFVLFLFLLFCFCFFYKWAQLTCSVMGLHWQIQSFREETQDLIGIVGSLTNKCDYQRKQGR